MHRNIENFMYVLFLQENKLFYLLHIQNILEENIFGGQCFDGTKENWL